MADTPKIDLVGASGEAVTLGPCLGGLVQTWDGKGEPALWRCEDWQLLEQLQGKGLISRTLRDNPPVEGRKPRYREAGILFADEGLLLVQNRFPTSHKPPEEQPEGENGQVEVEAWQIKLVPYTVEDPGSERVLDDLQKLLEEVVRAAFTNREYFIFELGGWNQPEEPFCLWSLYPGEQGLQSIVQVAPLPEGSNFWPMPGEAPEGAASLAAPFDPAQGDEAIEELVKAVPSLMLDAFVRWGNLPWEMSLTFGPWPFDSEPG